MPVGAAGMYPDRQAVAFGGRIDGPEVATPERYFAHREHQHLDEARVRRPPLDFVDRKFDILQRNDDRCAQTLVAFEPFPCDPIIERAGEGSRHVLVQHELHAIEAVAVRRRWLPPFSYPRPQAQAGISIYPPPPVGRGGDGACESLTAPKSARWVGS